MKIRRISKKERKEALQLVLDTFMEYEAPDYSEKGVETFKSFFADENYMDNLVIYGTFIDGKIISVIATRNNRNHIALFFVDGKMHRQGIGRRMFEEVLKNSTADKITVHSSPYAVEVYRCLGFIPTDTEQLTDGIRYTPMTYVK